MKNQIKMTIRRTFVAVTCAVSVMGTFGASNAFGSHDRTYQDDRQDDRRDAKGSKKQIQRSRKSRTNRRSQNSRYNRNSRNSRYYKFARYDRYDRRDRRSRYDRRNSRSRYDRRDDRSRRDQRDNRSRNDRRNNRYNRSNTNVRRKSPARYNPNQPHLLTGGLVFGLPSDDYKRSGMDTQVGIAAQYRYHFSGTNSGFAAGLSLKFALGGVTTFQGLAKVWWDIQIGSRFTFAPFLGIGYTSSGKVDGPAFQLGIEARFRFTNQIGLVLHLPLDFIGYAPSGNEVKFIMSFLSPTLSIAYSF